MDPVEIERTKLLANALNTACTSCFTVGIATPIAGYVYNVSGFRSVIAYSELALGLVGWLITMVGLHLMARRALRSLGQ